MNKFHHIGRHVFYLSLKSHYNIKYGVQYNFICPTLLKEIFSDVTNPVCKKIRVKVTKKLKRKHPQIALQQLAIMLRICHSAFLKNITSLKFIFHYKFSINEIAPLSVTVTNRSFSLNSFVASSNWGTKKPHRKVKLQVPIDIMADPKIEEILAPLRASVKEQVSFLFVRLSIRA